MSLAVAKSLLHDRGIKLNSILEPLIPSDNEVPRVNGPVIFSSKIWIH